MTLINAFSFKCITQTRPGNVWAHKCKSTAPTVSFSKNKTNFFVSCCFVCRILCCQKRSAIGRTLWWFAKPSLSFVSVGKNWNITQFFAIASPMADNKVTVVNFDFALFNCLACGRVCLCPLTGSAGIIRCSSYPTIHIPIAWMHARPAPCVVKLKSRNITSRWVGTNLTIGSLKKEKTNKTSLLIIISFFF